VSVELRLLFLNCYLLRALEFPARRPVVRLGSAPEIEERARELADRLAGEYEVACLAEVFDRREALTLSTPSKGPGPHLVVGPTPDGRRRFFTSSGLVDLVDGPKIVKSARHIFGHRGSPLHDPDALACKGGLFVELDVGLSANLEVVSTHLIAGGDLFPRGGLRRTDEERRAASNTLRILRQAQVAELAHFIATHHKPANTTLVVGDFNIAHRDPDADDPAGPYEDLLRSLSSPIELWDECSPGGHGMTANLTGPGSVAFVADPTDPRFFADDEPLPAATDEVSRIDHAFLQVESRSAIEVTPSTIRRRRLPRDEPSENHDIQYLSDHVGLHLELTLTDR